MDFALHTTSAKALAYRPAAEPIDTDWLTDVSFADLLEMRDGASDEGDWRGCDEIDVELRRRRVEAEAKLKALFPRALEAAGELPWADAGKLTTRSVAWYLRETLDNDAGTNTAVLLMLDAAYRTEAISAMAAGYARESAEDLLRAGLDVEGL